MNLNDGSFFSLLLNPQARFWNPPWNDPAKFPRAEPVGDDEVIMRLQEIEHQLDRMRELREQMNQLQEQITIVQADADAQKARVFPLIRKHYPSVAGGYGYGWRNYEGRYYAVGWNTPTPEQLNQQQGGDAPPSTEGE